MHTDTYSTSAYVLRAYSSDTCVASQISHGAALAAGTKAIKQAFPRAQVALIGCRWNAYRKPREDNWNKQVLQDPINCQHAGTRHRPRLS